MFRYDAHEYFGDSSSSMFWSCSVAGKGVFSNKMPLLRAGNIIEAPAKGSGSLGSALSYSSSAASLPVLTTCHTSTRQILVYMSAPSVLWPNIAEDAPVTSVNVLPRNLLARD